MNTPYVKKYDKNGNVTNPIKHGLFHQEPNREARRKELKAYRFYGNGKNYHLTIFKNAKYKRVRQIAITKKGEVNVIEHYVLQ